MKYSDQLQTKEWKAKRLEILERDGNKCCDCESTRNLQVHHLEYHDNKKAWEYDNQYLKTLCEYCHTSLHGNHVYCPEPYENKKLRITPEWKIKKTLILKRDSNECKVCTTKKDLNLYQRYYISNTPPWKHDDDAFFVACSKCRRMLIKNVVVPFHNKRIWELEIELSNITSYEDCVEFIKQLDTKHIVEYRIVNKIHEYSKELIKAGIISKVSRKSEYNILI